MKTSNIPQITIYTDGACHPNPGPGGWAAILLKPDQNEPQEFAGAESHTTNNRMELRAAAEGLRSLSEPHRVDVYTDSKYLRQGITEWLPNWEQRNWQTMGKKDVKNKDLWQTLSGQQARHEVYWHWVKGHAGNKWNERADKLAVAQLPQIKLPLDDENAIHIFTAASYLGKSKKGGWGVIMRYREHTKTLNGHETKTSGNRMHIQSAIHGLQTVKRSIPIHIYTSSDYLRDGATRWVNGWQNRDWKTKDGKAVSHKELWQILIGLTSSYQVSWHVIPKNNPPQEMGEAKTLATDAAKQG
ncbi:ribonuclease HI [Anaerolineales bacterium HSG25]|nr:ribonuclease HI [Anaerolineales bacterium HSG25]